MNRYKWLGLFLLSIILIIGSQPRLTQAATTIIYVNAAATGANNGSSWANAFTDLQAALAAANPGGGDNIEIWVAKGTYKPSSSGDREATFTLKNRVALYGGFAGTETQRNQRNFTTNVTILSGDLQGNDGPFAIGETSLTENSKIIVTGSGVDNSAILDGFQVSGGYNAVGTTYGYGAGVKLSSGAGVLLSNLTITRNLAGVGAGVYSSSSSPVMTNIRFINNYAVFDGGAIFTVFGSSPKAHNSLFSNNIADSGGAIYNSGANLTVVNSSSSGNLAADGGFLYTEDTATVTLDNIITWNDVAGSGNIIANNATTPSTINVSYSIVQGGFAGGTNIIDQNPFFADATNNDLSLVEGSPAIDAGDNSKVPIDTTDLDQDGDSAEALPLDLAGNPRRNDHPQADTGNGTAPLVDIGAYETVTPVLLTVSGQVTDDNGNPLAGVIISPITIKGLETSQVIQNLDNTIPLVQDKETVSRIYAQSSGPGLVVSILLSGSRDGAALAGSPLSIATTASTATPARGSYNSSANFSLPAGWLSGQVTLKASLDPNSSDAVGVTDANGMYSIKLKAGSYTITPQSDTASFISKPVTLTDQDQTLNFSTADQLQLYLPLVLKNSSGSSPAAVASLQTATNPDQFNDKRSFTVTFTNLPDLDVKIVPISYTHTANGTTYPAPTADEVTGIKDYLKFRYPVKAVNVTVATAINMTGNAQTGQALDDMLTQLAQIKQNDGAPQSQVYYGISKMSGSVAGAAGVSFFGVRVGTGIDTNGFLAAHEIGHTLTLLHPCEDPDSPYQSNSLIGEYGLNLESTPPQVYGPNDTTSIMRPGCQHPSGSYSWFSDYEYKKMYTDQLTNGSLLALQEIGEILAIRATFDGQDEPHLQPIYVFTATPTVAPADSAYAVELLDAEGQVMASHPVQVSETGQDDGHDQLRLILARLPKPAGTVALARLLRDGQVVDERAVAAIGSVEPTVSEGVDKVTLSWGQATAPALVRYSADGGATWNTIGLDVLGGELVIDRSALPAGEAQFQVILGN